MSHQPHIPLSSIDNNLSHIPKMRKNSKSAMHNRQSMIGRPRLSTVPTSSSKKNTGVPKNSTISRKRTTIYSHSEQNAPSIANTMIPKDPRPLKDRQYQETMKSEIFTYLKENGFEADTKHPLTEKTLRSPTQKDFVVIFNWLFRQIDPGHTATRSLESDVFLLLRIVRYPYIATVSKSQISAVGGHNWYMFLGMLHWLVKCAYFLKPADPEPEDTDADPAEKLNGMFFRYVRNAYRLFLMSRDDYSSLQRDLRSEFHAYMGVIESSVEDVQKEHDALKERHAALVKEDQTIDSGNRRTQAFELDIHKFRTYIKSVEARRIKWAANISKMEAEAEKLRVQNAELGNEVRAVTQKLAAHGLALQDVRNLIEDRKTVLEDRENAQKLLQERTERLRELENEARRHFDSLQEIIKSYNMDSYAISTVAQTEYNMEMDTEVVLDDFLAEERLGMRSEELVGSQGLRTTKKSQLKQFHKLVREKSFKVNDELIKLQNSVDYLGEKLSERSELLDTLEAKLTSLRIQSDELYNIMALELNAANTETEKLEMQLQSLRSSVDSGSMDVDQKIHAKEIELDRVENETRVSREALHKQVQQIIEGVVAFKMEVQEELESLGQTVNQEVEEAKQSN